jgi:hypothetical protein
VNHGSVLTIPAGPGLSKSGCVFGGWNIANDGTGINYAAGDGYTPSANITFFALWIQGSGTPGDPFLIPHEAALQLVGRGGVFTLSASYKVTANIPMRDGNWIPIGTDTDPFTGSFDGSNRTISGLKMNTTVSENIGLFGYIDTPAQVKDITLSSLTINAPSSENVGGIVGYLYDGTVQGCLVLSTCRVTGRERVGGVVGWNQFGLVDDCSASGTISGVNTSFSVGGVVGHNGQDMSGGNGTVQYCSFRSGTVSGDYCYTGGVVGKNWDGTVECCYSTGNVLGVDDVGGVVGWNAGSSAVTRYCYSTGSVSGDVYVGGVAGDNTEAIVEFCFATGIVSSPGIYGKAGGVVG